MKNADDFIVVASGPHTFKCSIVPIPGSGTRTMYAYTWSNPPAPLQRMMTKNQLTCRSQILLTPADLLQVVRDIRKAYQMELDEMRAERKLKMYTDEK